MDTTCPARVRGRGRSRGVRRPTDQELGGLSSASASGYATAASGYSTLGAVAMPPGTQQTWAYAPPPPAPSTGSAMSMWSTGTANLAPAIDALALGDGPGVGARVVKPQQFDDLPQVGGAEVAVACSGRGARRGRREELALLCTRPSHVQGDKSGAVGQSLDVLSNYYRLVSMPNWCVYQYHLDFVPLVESSKMRRALVLEHRGMFGNAYVFDGMSDLKMTKRLDSLVTEVHSRRPTDGADITVRIKRVKELAPNNPEILRLFNTQMRRNLEQLDFVQINRHFFDKHRVSAFPQHGLELWQGVMTAVGQHDGGVLMVMDTVLKVLRRDSVRDILVSIRSASDYRGEATRRIVGAVVMTPYNNRTYRVDDIDWDRTPQSTFKQDGQDKSFIQYYQEHYGKSIQDANQPLLVCRPKEKDRRAGRNENTFLVPELCMLTGLTDEMRANSTVMRDLATRTRVEPPKRVQNLLEFIARINGSEAVQRDMQAWGMKFSDELVSIKARVLPTEKVIQASATHRYSATTADFSREIRDHQMHVTVSVDRWLVVCPQRESRACNDFIKQLVDVGRPIGVAMSLPQTVWLEDDRTGHYLRELRDKGASMQLVLLVVPNNRKERYDLIKRHACCEIGIPTQVVLARTISNQKNLRSVATNVAIQLNCKLGGEAWCLEIPLNNTMIIGYDTYPESGCKGQSAGAFVASMNRTFTRWYSRVAFHKTHQELGNTLAKHLQDAIGRYSKVNGGAMPERIVFFRAGVSDGQVPQVREWEIDPIVSSMRALFPETHQLKLAFVVVTKHTSTRFFARPNQAGTISNPPPGTAVDSEVTRPGRYDFFLVSQSVRQGTVAPTYYNIIHDTTGLKPDHMQRLAYKLTHLYFNWPGTVRVPAPCQYAHKLAFLAGTSLHAEPHKRLTTTLFYL
ncbi:piwi-like protein 1 [Haemaphysalis longicornis]